MEVTIRPYRDADETAVVALWQEVFPNPPSWNVPEHDIMRKLKVQRDLLLVALAGYDLIGSAMAGYDGHRGWVYYVAVRDQHRRKGIGTRLVQAVESALAELGCPKLNLQVRDGNAGAVEFYRKIGYQVEPRISMGKRLVVRVSHPGEGG